MNSIERRLLSVVTELGRLAGVNSEVYNFVFSRRVLTDSGGLQREKHIFLGSHF